MRVSLPFYSMRLCLPVILLCLAACGPKMSSLEELNTRAVRLPGGQVITAEAVSNPIDMQRGLMFRDSLAPGRGMLFLHQDAGRHAYWMYQCRIPLDILWLDAGQRIVEMSENTPPCPGPASQCPNYGGNKESKYVLELAGGMAKKYGLRIGDRLEF